MPTAVPVEAVSPSQPAELTHPLAGLLAFLWAERARGAVVELHLSNGQTVVPDRYAPDMSQGGLGVFAVADSDGAYTVTGVAWDSVSRIEVRGVKQLPDEFRP
jgi:hypothetical protein